MAKIQNVLKHLVTDESGQDLIEYALIASLIGLAAVATLSSLATQITTVFTSVGNKMVTS